MMGAAGGMHWSLWVLSLCLLVVGVTCSTQPKIYVADLPSKYNQDLLWNSSKPECKAELQTLLEHPLGAQLPGHANLSHRPYYGLEVHTHMQLLHRYKARVNTAQEADIIYVPFYATALVYDYGYLEHQSCQPQFQVKSNNHPQKDQIVEQFWEDSKTLLPLLGIKPHWITLAQLEMDHMHACGLWHWGSRLLCHPKAKELVVLATEPFTGTNPQRGYLRGNAFQDTPAEKKWVAAMAFSPDRPLHTAAYFRKALLAECQKRPQQCVQSETHLGTLKEVDILTLYATSSFCIQPHGDSATRSAIFDCMAIGQGLPVFFDPFLHGILPFSDVVRYEDISLLFEERLLKLGDGEFINQLTAASKSPQYTRDLGKLQLLRHIWQYWTQPHLDLVTYESMSKIADTDDALTMSLKAMLRRLCKLGRLAQFAEHCPS